MEHEKSLLFPTGQSKDSRPHNPEGVAICAPSHARRKDTIQGFYNGLSIEREGGKALSPKSVKNIHGILHKALQQAVAVGYIRFNPADACTLPRAEKKEISPLDEEQIATFLKTIEGHRHELLYKVALFTGMREGEVLGLMWDCVDFEKGTITIKRQLRREQKKGGPTTSPHQRTASPAPSPLPSGS